MPLQHTLLSSQDAYKACLAELSHFTPQQGSSQEWMLQLHITQKVGSFLQQIRCLKRAWEQFCADTPEAQPLFTRVFLSDASNQEAIAHAELPEDCGALSIIEQAPLDGTRVAIWVYLKSGITRFKDKAGSLCYKVGDHTHVWKGSDRSLQGDSEQQCRELFEKYSRELEAEGGNLFEHSIRTWLFVQNVDVNYQGVVEGRNEHFDEKGLTAETHFISSTGIQGRSADKRSLVHLDSYSLLGAQSEEIQFLYAPEHLNPTHEYGVRFERGTAVHLDDRSHCYISGTASIDNKGEVVHLGDIEAQCLRMLENVQALLAEAQADFKDIMHMIIYLRDMADYEVIAAMFEERFALIPKQIVLAPVCRPAWLIEMECITLRQRKGN